MPWRCIRDFFPWVVWDNANIHICARASASSGTCPRAGAQPGKRRVVTRVKVTTLMQNSWQGLTISLNFEFRDNYYPEDYVRPRTILGVKL